MKYCTNWSLVMTKELLIEVYETIRFVGSVAVSYVPKDVIYKKTLDAAQKQYRNECQSGDDNIDPVLALQLIRTMIKFVKPK